MKYCNGWKIFKLTQCRVLFAGNLDTIVGLVG